MKDFYFTPYNYDIDEALVSITLALAKNGLLTEGEKLIKIINYINKLEDDIYGHTE